MINNLHRSLFRPERGWDPVGQSYAENYEGKISESIIEEVMGYIEKHVGDLTGLQVLDIGGGPGHFSCEFARRGAAVLWYDVSHNYLQLATERAEALGLNIDFELGYIDQLPERLSGSFDLVFNRVCWYYGVSDSSMAWATTAPLKVGGYVYVECNNAKFTKSGGIKRLQCFLNERLNFKIGHPYPPSGRIEKLLRKAGIKILQSDCSRPDFDRVIGRRLQ